MICQICNISLKNKNGLGKHLYRSHKNITKKYYYDKYIKEISSICKCGKEKKFRGLGEGYRKYCSVSCRSSDQVIRSKLSKAKKGKKQSAEIIEKRIKNTNQIAKEASRKKTMMERYGVDNPSLVPEFFEKMKVKNKKFPPRTPEHSQKIISSKRKNGTLNHSNSIRTKISNSLNKYYQQDDNQSITLGSLPSNGRGHKSGHYDGILYRSSYELLFILFCKKNKIKIESCENKKRRVRYIYEGKKRWYYPDFYLPELDICIEIKPQSMMNDLFYTKKKFAEKIYKNFVVLTENELYDEAKLNEYFLS